jgi:putative polyhydroxyalkanoate system protein
VSKVQVRQPHTLGKAEARQRLQGFEELLRKYKVSLDWTGDKAAIKGMGVSGDVSISDAAVEVNVVLGMLARAAGVDAGKLQGSIEKRLKEAFA